MSYVSTSPPSLMHVYRLLIERNKDRYQTGRYSPFKLSLSIVHDGSLEDRSTVHSINKSNHTEFCLRFKNRTRGMFASK
ncbi:hypothetical protein K503DRAFT_327676 [Rhizopogon vinicolor AM-OR11-026]|uniref:Uncharacterized protein n=1 Tax=Rhizopogon vinicolor AM-OR11-026 TaxID=1314800 RepID=A0A1B7MU14_9AGAM|nr:hypothetical protein K503DRAFT_327676 [Rhizopogon vinicolor AM-OR11-026]